MNMLNTVTLLAMLAGNNGNASVARPQIVAFSPRPDACRTYNIGGHDATDGESCGDLVVYVQVTVIQHDNTSTDETPVTPTVIVITDDETPTDKPETCKNKNSGKDGTPSECNAGHGQEKRD